MVWEGVDWILLAQDWNQWVPLSDVSSFLKCVEFLKWLRTHKLVIMSYGKCRKRLALEQLHSNFSFITLITNNGMDRNFWGRNERIGEVSFIYRTTHILRPSFARTENFTHTHTHKHTNIHTHKHTHKYTNKHTHTYLFQRYYYTKCLHQFSE